jgi:WD40 repeat protein
MASTIDGGADCLTAARERVCALVAATSLLIAVAGCASAYVRPKTTPLPPAGVKAAATGDLRDVVLVGNNWEGTATVFDPVKFERLMSIDIVPDWNDRIAEIRSNPLRTAAFTVIRKVAGEGHNQLVDDLFTSQDGRLLFASRPSFADVVAINLETRKIVWRRPVEGTRADHAALSPDGQTLLVSASTAGKVHAIDTVTGEIVGGFKSGDEPHESNYSADGTRIYHASIGRVFLPLTSRALDFLKGERVFLVIDARTYQELDRFDMHERSKAAGEEFEWVHSAVRPMALAHDGRFIYFQMSFFHGFYEFDLEKKAIVRGPANLPVPDAVKKLPLARYQLNSAHHGITISGDDTKLCVAGTMSGYAAIVDRKTFKPNVIQVGEKPYWATTSADGRFCYVSVSSEDRVAVISFADEKAVASVRVGDHPQRVRTGKMRMISVQ